MVMNNLLIIYFRDFPGGPVTKTLGAPMQGAQVWPLVGELDSTCYN